LELTASELVTLENTFETLLATAGEIAPLAATRNAASRAYSTISCPRASFQIFNPLTTLISVVIEVFLLFDLILATSRILKKIKWYRFSRH